MPTIQEMLKSGMTVAEAKEAYKTSRQTSLAETEES
jgi:hypothetical protein